MADALTDRMAAHLAALCAFPDRRVGGPGNRAATRLFASVAEELGFDAETAVLDCLDWEHGPSELVAENEHLRLRAGPYSPPLAADAPLAHVSELDELEAGRFEGTVLLLSGELTRGQLMPKDFPFFHHERSQRIIAALEASGALAVIAATGRDPSLAGGAYPFPLLEDGGFGVPNAYIADVEGERLARHEGEQVRVVIDSRRLAASCEQLVARKAGRGPGRLLLTAHIDSKPGAPGALDNAVGVASLLGAAELLASRELSRAVELVPFNGEDYYATPGQLAWLAANEGRLGDIALALNVDGAGFVAGPTAMSLYGCGEELSGIVRQVASGHGLAEGPQWPQGDHSILAMRGVPAVALTSEQAFFVVTTVAHTAEDTLDKVDPSRVAEVARFLADAVVALDDL